MTEKYRPTYENVGKNYNHPQYAQSGFESKKIELLTKEFLPGLITTAAVPLTGLLYYFVTFFQMLSGGGTDDSAGWAVFFWMIIGVAIVPISLASGLPCLTYFAVRKSQAFFTTARTMLIICDVIFSVELIILGNLISWDSPRIGIVYWAAFIYFILSVVSFSTVAQAKERIHSDATDSQNQE